MTNNEILPVREKKKLNIRIPDYTLGEELFNSISHGIGAVFSIVALVLLVVKAHGVLAETAVSLYGSTMIVLYTISCIYHALSPNLEGKKVLRVIDHCNVFLLVYGTYIPAMLLGIGGRLGWLMCTGVGIVTLIGIILTCINIDKYTLPAVICHLVNGWSVVMVIPKLIQVMGIQGIIYIAVGGVMYTIGAILYGLGKKIRYMHSVFHIFCMLGTFFQFWGIYQYLL